MSDERTELPWSRFVAIGDSFTEGVGDPEADSPGGLRGWADRFAEVLAEHNSDLAYANLAVRGKLIRQITDEQLEAAIDLRPDLVSVCAGGNDVIRPGADPDAVAVQLDYLLRKLRERTFASVIECRPQEQVLGRIPGQRELRGQHERCALVSRLPRGCDDSLDIAVEVADDLIQLGERNPHGS